MTIGTAQLDQGRQETWPQILECSRGKYGDGAVAMRHKRRGVWQSFTWKDYAYHAKYWALGLLALGMERGDKALIVGDNAPEWYYAELAIQANHGVAVGASPEVTPAELLHFAANSDARFAVVQDQEQVDKLLEVKERLPLLCKIIFWNYKGLAHYDDPVLIGSREVAHLGEEHEKAHPGLYEQNIASGQADDVCAIVYTSGTAGASPKGAIHTFRTLRAGADRYLQLAPWRAGDHFVPYLPPVWIADQYLNVACHLLSGCTLDFAESPETYRRDAREAGPDIVSWQTRQWESQAVAAQAAILGSDWLKRFVFRLCMPIGLRMADRRYDRQKPNLAQQLVYALAALVLFKPMRNRLGLAKARICYSTGGVLNPEAARFYHALDLPLKNLYVTTEGGVVTGARDDAIHPDTVGPVHPGTEVRVTGEGELAYRHPGVFSGYYGDSDATARVLKEGWFFSGDSGRVREDGHIVLTDRLADVVDLKSGDKLAPQFVESQLRTSPFIKDAWVLAGPAGDFASAVVIINYSSVGRWAGKRRVGFTTFAELSQKVEVYDLVKQHINRVNRALPPGCRIRRYVNLHKEFDPDEGEMTRTRKLKRAVLQERYCALVSALYGNENHVSVQTLVAHREGRRGAVETRLMIQSLEGTVE